MFPVLIFAVSCLQAWENCVKWCLLLLKQIVCFQLFSFFPALWKAVLVIGVTVEQCVLERKCVVTGDGKSKCVKWTLVQETWGLVYIVMQVGLQTDMNVTFIKKMNASKFLCVCVCVCVKSEREKEREIAVSQENIKLYLCVQELCLPLFPFSFIQQIWTKHVLFYRHMDTHIKNKFNALEMGKRWNKAKRENYKQSRNTQVRPLPVKQNAARCN